MKSKNFQQMDAGEQREFLSEQFSVWKEAGFMSNAWINTFHRRVKILSRKIGVKSQVVMLALQEDNLV